MTALPEPDRWYIHKMTEPEVAEMIEECVEFYKKDKDGNRRSVHLPTQFVRHFMNRDDGVLPTVVAIGTMPIVLGDGHLLAPAGFDYERGIDFKIQPEVRAILPKDCSDKKIREERFLTDEWLCDVATTYYGKAIIIAAGLSIIERSILPERPAFWITAGRRGSGKTTAIMMLIKGITGLHPSSNAWATDENERRKTMMALFLEGEAYVLWDNIARGSQLSCPHIERACTSQFYSDRKLGVSEIVTAAASAIHIFTGNNIGPKGDLASRSLVARLDVEGLDPENRQFKHSDPIGWTDSMRAEIITALYTILLGNPALKLPHDAPMKTRFKLWQRIVGSAIEYAARLSGQDVDFSKLFPDSENDEEEGAELAEALQCLHDAGLPTEFKANDVTNIINNQSNPMLAHALRSFLFGDQPPTFQATAVAVGKHLKAHVDNPARCGDLTSP